MGAYRMRGPARSLAPGAYPAGGDASNPSTEQRRHELRRDLRDDGITVAPQSSHAPGYPINQRECSGLNRPPFPIPASKPVSIRPSAVSRAGPFASHATRPSSPFGGAVPSAAPSFQSRVVGVGHPVKSAAPGSLSATAPLE